MTTFFFFSFSINKISPYINFKKIFGRILAPPFGRRPGADAPPPCPPRYATALNPPLNTPLEIGTQEVTLLIRCPLYNHEYEDLDQFLLCVIL